MWVFCCPLLPRHTALAFSAAERGMWFASPDTLGKRNSYKKDNVPLPPPSLHSWTQLFLGKRALSHLKIGVSDKR